MTKDITIIGAGLAGIPQAILLARAGFSVNLVERADPEKLATIKNDFRASAIAAGSVAILDKAGLWQDIETEAQPLWDIRITNQSSPLFLHYDHQLIGNNAMGYIVPNSHILTCLYKHLQNYSNIQLIAPATFTHIEYLPNQVDITLDNGDILRSKLLIAADGRQSRVRKSAHIATHTWKYHQDGIVCTVKHEKDHQGVAQERFLPSGPFAILPLKGGHHSSLVWTEKQHLTPIFLEMNKAEVTEAIQQRFGEFLGRVELASELQYYPLTAFRAKQFISHRLALIADAAHGIHPIAGQGLNVGLRDVDYLTDVLINAKQCGLDIGANALLETYEQTRKSDMMLMLSITDGLNALFSNDNPILSATRSAGLGLVEKLPGLKKLFMRHAMGGLN